MSARSLRPRNESTHNGKWEVFGGWERVGLWTTGAEGHAYNRDMARTDRGRLTLMLDEKFSGGSPK